MTALLVLAAVAVTCAAGLLATAVYLGRRPGLGVAWERRLGHAAWVSGLLVAVLTVQIGPVRWALIAAAEPEGPGGKSSQPAPVDREKLFQQEVARQELEPSGPEVTVSDPEVVGRLTGSDGVNTTAERWNVHGTDLGHLFEHDGHLHLGFGDTFGPGKLGGDDWRSNTMALVGSAQRRRLQFERMVTDRRGHADELLPSKKIDGLEKTVIPTYGTAVGERIYLHYMSVKTWQGPGRWLVNHAGLAYSDDEGETWTKKTAVRWPGDSNFAQAAFVRDGGWLYVFGIPAGRFGAAHLARVRPDAILEPTAYRYWNGEAWTRDREAAAPVVPAPVSELSVAWSEAHQRWLMLYLHQPREGVVVRTARRLTGPWSAPELVVSAADFPTLYGPFIVPGSVTDDSIRFTLSRYGPYNVFNLRARLEGAR